MTVLHGDLAIQQSKTLIRLFKFMKDYIVETNLLGSSSLFSGKGNSIVLTMVLCVGLAATAAMVLVSGKRRHQG